MENIMSISNDNPELAFIIEVYSDGCFRVKDSCGCDVELVNDEPDTLCKSTTPLALAKSMNITCYPNG
jgi:hypothetical protein